MVKLGSQIFQNIISLLLTIHEWILYKYWTCEWIKIAGCHAVVFNIFKDEGWIFITNMQIFNLCSTVLRNWHNSGEIFSLLTQIWPSFTVEPTHNKLLFFGLDFMGRIRIWPIHQPDTRHSNRIAYLHANKAALQSLTITPCYTPPSP